MNKVDEAVRILGTTTGLNVPQAMILAGFSKKGDNQRDHRAQDDTTKLALATTRTKTTKTATTATTRMWDEDEDEEQ